MRGADGRNARDRKAGNVVFQLPEARPSGVRSTLPLNGIWEICRDDEQRSGPVAEPIGKLPANPVWRAIAVPGDKNTLRPDLVFAHRVWYRTRVNIPSAAAGHSFFLVFPQNNLNTTVYVNGVVCGFDKNPFARVQIDVSKAVKLGTNEVLVGIHDAWHGYSASPTDPMKLRRCWNLPKKFFGDGFQDLAYLIWNHAEFGILVTPTLIAAGSAYVADVFCKPSVAHQSLKVDVTLANPGSQAAAGEVLCEAASADDQVNKVLGSERFQLDVGQEATLRLNTTWANPQVRWPDKPRLYSLRTTVKLNGRVVDVSQTEFTFREWMITGRNFRLNGVPWHGWADTDAHSTPQEWLGFYRQSHQTFMRFWGTSWMNLPPDEALAFLDKNGVMVRRSGMHDGKAIGYWAIENDPELKKKYRSEIKIELIDNWGDQVVA